MALSDEWTEWHLTPRGWERGAYRTDFGTDDRQAKDPPGSVAVYRYREYQSSMYSEQEVTFDLERGDLSSGEGARLLQLYPDLPRHL